MYINRKNWSSRWITTSEFKTGPSTLHKKISHEEEFCSIFLRASTEYQIHYEMLGHQNNIRIAM